MKTKITSIFALALLITACSNENDPINGGQGGEEKSEILVGTKVVTRASVESNDESVLTISETLDVNFLRAEDSATEDWETTTTSAQTPQGTGPGVVAAKLKVTAGANDLKFTNSQYYNTDPNLSSFLKGYYPNDAALEKGSNQFVTATWEIDGKTDVMVSNYISGKKTDVTTPRELEFRHLLSRVTVNIIAEDAAAAAGWGSVTGIVIKTKVTQISHTFDGEKADENQYDSSPVEASVEDNIPIYSVSDNRITDDVTGTVDIPTDLSSKMYGQAMVYPAKTYSLDVTTSNGTVTNVTATITDTNGAQAGKNHLITLTFRASEITATTKVIAWGDGSGADPVIVQ